jgi:tetratricopeptide (TPR) repeat protein
MIALFAAATPEKLDCRKIAERGLNRWILAWVFGWLPAVFANTSCRALTSGQTNKPLVSARQLSLRGADALQRGRSSDAELLFSQSLAQSPLDERAHWGYATTLWDRGDKQTATFHMAEALRLSGRNPEYAIRLGEMNLELGNIADAKNIALDVLSANRNHAQAWSLLGDTHRAEKDWDNAMECYHRALLIRSDYPKVQLAMADIYRKRGRPQRALAMLDRMTDINADISENPEHMLLRGLTFADLHRDQDATSLLASCSEHLSADSWRKQLEVAEAQYRLGALVEARMTMGRIPNDHITDAAVLSFKNKLDSSFDQWSAQHPGQLPSEQQARTMQSSENRVASSVPEPRIGPVEPKPLRGLPTGYRQDATQKR